MPPNKDINILIYLETYTHPIYITPYHMPLAMFGELKTQLQKLFYKGLINPSALPWGAQDLFIQNNDGFMSMRIYHR